MIDSNNTKRSEMNQIVSNGKISAIQIEEYDDSQDGNSSFDDQRIAPGRRVWQVNRRLQFKHGRLVPDNPKDIEDIKLARHY